jgi:DNA-binding transcriptional ArsR family regulator
MMIIMTDGQPSQAPRRLDPAVLEHAAGVLRVLAHPARLRIVELLMQQRHSVGELADQLELPQNAVSQHLSHMKLSGILGVERVGRSAYYYVDNPNACHVIECIRQHGHGRGGLSSETSDHEETSS